MRPAAALLLGLLMSASAWAQSPPSLSIEGPPELAPASRRLEAFDLRPLSTIVRLVGLQSPGPPMRVVLTGDASEWARQVPPWAAGFAVGDRSLIVLFPARSPVYPHDTLEDVLRHEVAHVLISRAAEGHAVPRWFHEGLAVAVERPWDLEDRTRLVSTLLFGPRLGVTAIDALFLGDEGSQQRAYVLSAALVRHLIREHGSDAPARALREVARGRPFDIALASVTAQALPRFEDGFWRSQRTWTTWVPLIASSGVLWLGVIGLGALAVRRRRQRSRQIRDAWAREDVSAAAPAGDESGDEGLPS
jgi:MYXO-CTERM domain-containing protein